MSAPDDAQAATLRHGIRARHPGLREAVLEDARVTCAYRLERHEFRSRVDAFGQALRLCWISDAFLAHVLYRLKARLQALGVPVLPRLLHRLTVTTAQVSIGDSVVMAPGVYLIHGQVVIDGFVEIATGAVIGPFVTIGTRGGDFGAPTLRPNVHVGTGAKLLGRITIGEGAQIGANAVVIADVAEGATVVGLPGHERLPGT